MTSAAMWYKTNCISHTYQLTNLSVNKHSVRICFVQEPRLNLLNFVCFLKLNEFQNIFEDRFSTSVMFWRSWAQLPRASPLPYFTWPQRLWIWHSLGLDLKAQSVSMMPFCWVLLHSWKLYIWVIGKLRLQTRWTFRSYFLKLESKQSFLHQTVG